ncbi:MAG: hypothetical protein EOR53_17950 [Mesorhizobium sp.]|uniref:hypothetical protein n=1 Tax=Mesorhizobium sp. TaxID=1871066 RepID=UPI000FD33F55|nr:hypothetical protein [Mesorhizobium sp.]RUV98271.1 hypothetical protein EOA88_00065 [Mesorhizobium sp. M5C.F.Ca.IN.020.14.1.1]RWK94497.1 MAG: hypothetical protein EOR53_17950 [Mesorhizobium sp.]TJW57509.1 MAG: hypothetical protein E5X59_00920 [Mesorhizobium sp.]
MKAEPLDETWKYRIPESLADLIPLFENRVACHRLWAEWLDQDTDETRRYAEHGIGPAKAHWDYVKQYSAAKSLIEEYERAIGQAASERLVQLLYRLLRDHPEIDLMAHIAETSSAPAIFSLPDLEILARRFAAEVDPSPDNGTVAEALRALEAKAISQKSYFNEKQHELPSLEDFTDIEGNLSLPDDVSPLLLQAEANGRYSEADWWLSTIRTALAAAPGGGSGADHG